MVCVCLGACKQCIANLSNFGGNWVVWRMSMLLNITEAHKNPLPWLQLVTFWACPEHTVWEFWTCFQGTLVCCILKQECTVFSRLVRASQLWQLKWAVYGMFVMFSSCSWRYQNGTHSTT